MLRVYPSLHVSEFTSPSATFICHLAFVHPPPGPQVPGTSAGSAGPSVKLFWYVKTLLNGVGSIGIHWGATLYWIFLTYRLNRLPENYRTPGVSSSYPMVWHSTFWDILGVFGSSRGPCQNCADRNDFLGAGTCAVDNACARRKQRLANIMKPTFRVNGGFAVFWNFRFFWHGISSVLEYG